MRVFIAGVDIFTYTRAEMERILEAGNLFMKSVPREGRELGGDEE